uniref:CUB domain-containing protein n=1 Tax=Panagrolaimus sp. PS1159 TaxID=55785 RepID=A0AC35F3H6_9BILA
MAAFLLSLIFIIEKTIADCGREQIIGGKNRNGEITSPRYPNGYPGKQRCIFNLTAEPGYVVHIIFIDFDLEDVYSRSAQCLKDYIILTVTDGEGRLHHIGQRYCGKQIPNPLQTMQSNVLLTFVSTYSSKRRGFRLQYEFVPEAQVLQPMSIYGDPDTRWRRECGGHNDQNEINGEITSPGFPNTYPKNVTCNWLLRVNTQKRIYIRIVHLELSPTISECERASLYIIDGYKHDFMISGSRKWLDQSNEIKFCGGQLYYKDEGMKSYLSQGNRVIIKFVTHDTPAIEQFLKYEEEGNPIGFKLIWTEVNSLVNEGITSKPCEGFTCKGGEFCIDDGHNICAERTRLCINKTLQCNGIANCAENDSSDENNSLLHRVAMRREIQRRLQERAKSVKESINSRLQNDSSNHQIISETNSNNNRNSGNDFSQRLRRLSPAFFTWSRRTSGAESTTPSLTLQETSFRDPQSIWQRESSSPRPPKVVKLEPLQAKTLHRRSGGAPIAFDETEIIGGQQRQQQTSFSSRKSTTDGILALKHSALV